MLLLDVMGQNIAGLCPMISIPAGIIGLGNGFLWQFAHTQLVVRAIVRANNASWELHGVVIFLNKRDGHGL